jgi:hypothetical protein
MRGAIACCIRAWREFNQNLVYLENDFVSKTCGHDDDLTIA